MKQSFDTPLLGAVYMVEENVSARRQDLDLENIHAKGLNTIVMWPPVSPWDSPDGVSMAFDSVDRVMDKCHALGLRVIVELEGQNPAFQFAPDYQYKPEHRTVSDRARHWVNYYHPEVQTAMKAYIQAVATHFKGHPALLGYDVFNEVNFHSTDVYTERAFRGWLKDKYTTPRVLNRIWKRFYTDFDQVLIENLHLNYSRWSSLRPLLDFEDFRADAIQSFVNTWGDAVRAVDPDPLIIADNSWSMTTFDTTTLANDDWKISSVVDSFGLSVYPQSWDVRLRDDPCAIAQIYRGGISAGHDSSGKPVMISELQTHNQTALAKGSSVFDEIKLWTWQAFAHGADGLIYWKWNPFTTGFQVSGRGMTASDGTPNDRADQAAACAEILNRSPESFIGRTVYHNHVYLIYSPACDRFTDLILPDDPGAYRRSLAAWYRHFWLKGVQPRFITPEELGGLDAGAGSLLIAPFLSMLSRQAASDLAGLVQRGVKVIADGRLAIVDENGFAYDQAPGTLQDCLGYQETDYLSPYPHGSSAFDRFSKVQLRGGQAGARTDAGDPLTVTTQNTLYLAVPFGIDHDDGALREAVDTFIDRHMARDMAVLQKDAEVDVVISQGKGTMVSAVNYKSAPTTVVVRLNSGQTLTNLTEQSPAALEGQVVTLQIPAREIACVVVTS